MGIGDGIIVGIVGVINGYNYEIWYQYYGWQSETTDGLKGDWSPSLFLSLLLSFSLFL